MSYPSDFDWHVTIAASTGSLVSLAVKVENLGPGRSEEVVKYILEIRDAYHTTIYVV